MAANHQDVFSNQVLSQPILFQFSQEPKILDNLSPEEKTEFLGLLRELFKGYQALIQEISLEELTLKSGVKIKLLPEKKIRLTQDVLNDPSLIEQMLPIYIPGADWKDNSLHDCHAGRIRNLDFFKNVFGKTEDAVKKNLDEINWLPEIFPGKTLPITKILGVSAKFLAISAELKKLSTDIRRDYLESPSGTFNWRNIAGTNRLSAHSFGMTLDLTADHCQYWLWDYKAQKELLRTAPVLEDEILEEDIPSWRNSVPFEIVDLFEKHGWMWGGKWRNYDTMHFEYRPECFVEPEIKQRIRALLEKAGYQLLPPLQFQEKIPFKSQLF